jgi:hypothetical protein
MELKIETGIPIPSDVKGQSLSEMSKFFRDMQVANSVLVPTGMVKAKDPGSKIRSWFRVAQKHGAKFVVRTVDGGYRIWRIA